MTCLRFHNFMFKSQNNTSGSETCLRKLYFNFTKAFFLLLKMKTLGFKHVFSDAQFTMS